jgi:SNF2 family DNA or RNA helicase
MIVVEQVKALALKLNNPAAVLASVATAKPLTYKGKGLVIVPHKLDEVRVLRNLGIDAPSPIMHYYDWPGRWTPYVHQKETAAFLTLVMRGLVLNEIGTGKTDSALWAADYLMKTKKVKKVLIISPLSTLERVWGDAVFTQFFHRKAVVLHGSAEYRKKMLKSDADFFIINHDGFAIIAKEAIGLFDLVIVDEAAVLRNPSTNRYKTFKRWMDMNPDIRLWLMTGTPTPNEPTDAWALAKLVNSPFCTGSYTNFRDQVMTKQGMYRWIPRFDAVHTVQHILQPSIRYNRDECLDLPDTIYSTRKVPLTPEQKKYYDKMLKSFYIELAADRIGAVPITAVNEAVKLGKLVQIACGVAYDDAGNNVELDCSPRIKEVVDLIEQAGEKVIVFVPLTGTLEMLERELAKKFTVAVVNGNVSATKRNIIFQNFQDDIDPHVLLAHPATMAHGLTLTSASTIIWYGPITSNEQYVQANGRVERIGKRHVSNVIHIEGTELEHKMYQRLKNKQALQGLLLELIQQKTKG